MIIPILIIFYSCISNSKSSVKSQLQSPRVYSLSKDIDAKGAAEEFVAERFGAAYSEEFKEPFDLVDIGDGKYQCESYVRALYSNGAKGAWHKFKVIVYKSGNRWMEYSVTIE